MLMLTSWITLHGDLDELLLPKHFDFCKWTTTSNLWLIDPIIVSFQQLFASLRSFLWTSLLESHLSMLTATRLMTKARAVSILMYSFNLQMPPPTTMAPWLRWSLATSRGMKRTRRRSSAQERLARKSRVLMLWRRVWVTWRKKRRQVCPITPTRNTTRWSRRLYRSSGWWLKLVHVN